MTRILRFLQFRSYINDNNNTINNITNATTTSDTGNNTTASLCGNQSCIRKPLQKQKNSTNTADPNTTHIGTETKPRFTDQNVVSKFFALFLVFRSQVAACLRRKSRSLQPRISNVSGSITTARAHERQIFWLKPASGICRVTGRQTAALWTPGRHTPLPLAETRIQ